MLNIVIITPGFAVNENDTSCVPFLQLYIRDLLKNNIKLTIIALQYPATENYSWHGIDVVTITKNEPKIISKLAYKFRLHHALKKIQVHNKIDVIHHIWFNNEVYLSEKFATKHKIKHITTFAGQDVLKKNKALKMINKYQGTLVCVSLFQQLAFEKLHQNKTELIHWGIEDIDVNYVPKSIDLISCGSINSIKNHSEFIDIVYEISKTIQNLKIVICGDGEGLVALNTRIENLNLSHIIELKGSIPRTDVIELMKQSKMLIHTSHYEGFGLVLVEALACGCKVISSPVGIAFDNQSIISCNTTAEFVKEIIAQFQSTGNKSESINDYPINKTTLNYLDLYIKNE